MDRKRRLRDLSKGVAQNVVRDRVSEALWWLLGVTMGALGITDWLWDLWYDPYWLFNPITRTGVVLIGVTIIVWRIWPTGRAAPPPDDAPQQAKLSPQRDIDSSRHIESEKGDGKPFIRVRINGGTYEILESYNIEGVTDKGTGLIDVHFADTVNVDSLVLRVYGDRNLTWKVIAKSPYSVSLTFDSPEPELVKIVFDDSDP